MRSFEVGVVGAGYVGLVTGACLAYLGHRVICVDNDPRRVEGLERGQLPIHEPHLESLIQECGDRITFSTKLAQAVERCDVLFIAVDTPQSENGSAELYSVASVAREIGWGIAATGRDASRPIVVVNKSTVPVGTAARVREIIRRETTHPFSVVSNPEFLKQGAAIDDFMKPDRVVVAP